MSYRIATFDIETCPTEVGLARLIEKKGTEIEAPANYKDPAKIAAYCAEKRANLQAQCEKDASFSPLYGQIVAASLWDGAEGGAMHLRSPGIEGSEALLLKAIAEALSDVDLVVTFNGHNFDLPFTSTRMLVHGITPPACLSSRRYQLAPHCDLYAFLTGWAEHGKGGLADWCALFEVPCPDKDMGLTGADVARMVREGQWDTLSDYSFGGAVSPWNLLCKLWPVLRRQIPGAQGIELQQADNGSLATVA